MKYISILLGCVICALSYAIFLIPHQIVPGGVTGIAKRGLDDHIIAQAMFLADLLQVRVAFDIRQGIWRTGHPGLVADPHRLDLVVDAVAHRRRREPDLHAVLAGEFLRLFVEHQEHRLRLTAAFYLLFPLPQFYRGKVLSVTGFLEEYKGKPQIMAFFPNQIEMKEN